MSLLKKLFSSFFGDKRIPDIKYPNTEPDFIMYDNPIRKKVDNIKRIEHTKPDNILKDTKKSNLSNIKTKEVGMNEKPYYKLTSIKSQTLKHNSNNKPNLSLIKKSSDIKTNSEKTNLIEDSKSTFNSNLDKQQSEEELIYNSPDFLSNDKVETKTTITENAFKKEPVKKYSTQKQNYSIGFKSLTIPRNQSSSQKSSTNSGYNFDFKSTENPTDSSEFKNNSEVSQIEQKQTKSSGYCFNSNQNKFDINENQTSSSGFCFNPEPVTYSFGFKNSTNFSKLQQPNVKKKNSPAYTEKIESTGFKYNADFGKQQSNLSGYKFNQNSGNSILNKKQSNSVGFVFDFNNQKTDKKGKKNKDYFDSNSVNFKFPIDQTFKADVKNDFNSSKKNSSGFDFHFDSNSQTKEKSSSLPPGFKSRQTESNSSRYKFKPQSTESNSPSGYKFKSQSTESNSPSGYNFNHSENLEGIKPYQQSASNGFTPKINLSNSYGFKNNSNIKDHKTEKFSGYKFNYNLSNSNSNSNQTKSSGSKFKFTYNSNKTQTSGYKFETNSQKEEIWPTSSGYDFSPNSDYTQQIVNPYKQHLTEQSSGYNFSFVEEKPYKSYSESQYYSNTSQKKEKRTKSPSGFNFIFKE